MDSFVLGIDGMTCNGCVASVERALSALPGVTEVSVSLEPSQAEVVIDPAAASRADVARAVEEAGFDVVG